MGNICNICKTSNPIIQGTIMQRIYIYIRSSVFSRHPFMLHCLRGKWGKKPDPLCRLNWWRTACWRCCGSLRVHGGGFVETQTHGRNAVRPRGVGMSLVAGSPGNKWPKSAGTEQMGVGGGKGENRNSQ